MMPHASEVTLYGISIVYTLFALQLLWQTKWRQVDLVGGCVIATLAFIFLFCGYAGYLSELLGIEWVYVVEIAHLILLGLSSAIVIGNGARTITDRVNFYAQAHKRRDYDDNTR